VAQLLPFSLYLLPFPLAVLPAFVRGLRWDESPASLHSFCGGRGGSILPGAGKGRSSPGTEAAWAVFPGGPTVKKLLHMK
jgi:hypothetical protein